MLAAALLTLMPSTRFSGTVIGFAASTLLSLRRLPKAPTIEMAGGIYDKTTRGCGSISPRLRGLLGIVNTVVIVRGLREPPDTDVAYALAARSGGFMIAALALPRLLDRLQDRRVMLPGRQRADGPSDLLRGNALLRAEERHLGSAPRDLVAAWGAGVDCPDADGQVPAPV